MFHLVVTTFDQSESVASDLRSSGYEMIDTIAVQLPEDVIYAYLIRDTTEETIAEEAVLHGCDRLIDIDAGRVGTSKDVPSSPKQVQSSVHTVSMTNNEEGSGFDPNIGRWPNNTVFVHKEGCEIEETKTDDTCCQAECPIQDLNRQSGSCDGAGLYPGKQQENRNSSVYGTGKQQGRLYEDSGGASRFHYQAQSLEEALSYLQGMIHRLEAFLQ